MLKKLTLCLYTMLILCMGIATIVERLYGTDIAATYIYGAWWFVALWAALAAAGVAMLWRRRLPLAVVLLHVALIGILAGAFVTYLTAERGTISLRMDVAQTHFENSETHHVAQLPFALTLRDFRVVNYPGTDAPMDFQSSVEATQPDSEPQRLTISMNNIGSCQGYRFYQSSYDEDLQGTHLLVSHDPYGIAVTYASYLLLLLSFIALAVRRLSSVVRRPLSVFCFLLFCTSGWAAEVPEVSPEIAHDLGQVAVLYNGRICPLNTAATDFVTKLSGKASWHGLSADEVFLGWMIYYGDWEQQPIIRVKSTEVQRLLGTADGWASLRDFYTPTGDYKLQPYLNDATLPTSQRKAVMEADEKVRVVSMFYAGEFIRIFPLEGHWYAPGSTELPKDVPTREFLFVKRAMDQVVQATLAHDEARAATLIAKIRLYQRAHASLPRTLPVEVYYNHLLSKRVLIMLMLGISLVLCVLAMLRGETLRLRRALLLLQCHILGYATLMIGLRWLVSGHVPLSNGLETMQFMAFVITLLTLLLRHRSSTLNATGPVVASLALLVSMIACGSPRITPLMPVLQSPLMTLHVMMVMLAYSLFAIMALLSARELVGGSLGRSGSLGGSEGSERLLLPAVALLAIGIFLGAVWANISWGRYWGWDPKETWALITLMIYALPLHSSLLPCLQRQTSEQSARAYHIYILLAFLAVLMTYFGVNYLLPGMHSYA